MRLLFTVSSTNAITLCMASSPGTISLNMVTAAVRLNSVSNLVWNLAAGGPRLPDGPGVRVALTLDGLLQDAQAALALVRERGAVVERADALHLVLPLVHVERHLHVARRRGVPLRARVLQQGRTREFFQLT